MPRFHYIAITADGKKVKGAIAAESSYVARKQLRARSIHPTSVTEVNSRAESKTALLSILSKSNKNQIIDFTKQMATLLHSGIKLTDALSVLTMQMSDARLKHALTDIRDRVVTGESFTDALADYGDYFDVIYSRRRGHRHIGRELFNHRQFHGKTPARRIKSKDGNGLSGIPDGFLHGGNNHFNYGGHPEDRRTNPQHRTGTALDYQTVNERQLCAYKRLGTSGFSGNHRDYLEHQTVLQDRTRSLLKRQVSAFSSDIRAAH